ncbi:hypothetical protein HDV63DRAFT_413242 [Trichoderma sp. SZMC 28014]
MITFESTRDAILDIIHSESYVTQPEDGMPTELDIYSFERERIDGTIHVYSDLERKKRARDWCIDLRKEFANPAAHVQILEERYSKLVECHFRPVEDVEDMVQKIDKILERMPRLASEFHDPLTDLPYRTLDKGYFFADSDPSWESLLVANTVSRNVLRIAVQIQIVLGGDSNYAERFQLLLDITVEVLREIISLSQEEPSPEWFVIRTYFWTSWQRAITLYHYYVLQEQLLWGYDTHRDITNPLDGSDVIKMVERLNQSKTDEQHPPYVCKWALRLLREDKAVVGQDYRRFYSRLSQTFAANVPRCVVSTDREPTNCNGKQPGQCLRLSGLRIENQSAHAPDCDGSCSPLYWDEDSWRRIGGAAAVSFDLDADGRLHYVNASAQTMAISHVWSHGQGGRPENDAAKGGTGLNGCLHRRYSRIAKSHGCDSYWMDTPCIPSDHVLRKEAIANINVIFAASQLTLVCDKDLMAIDYQSDDIATKEAIISTVLVCDWNVRAWTLLEALRGRHNLHLLCKHDVVVSLRDVLRDVCNNGCIEVAALFLSAQHLLPSQPYVHGKSNDHPSQSTKWIVDRRKGFVDIKEAASLLSHRHASRPGDEVVIWSLLTGDKVFSEAESLWLSQERGIPSGWLVSSYERLEHVKGLSWAPSRPNFPLHGEGSHADYDKLLLPYSGRDTRFTKITQQGLRGLWWAYTFQAQQETVDCVPAVLAASSLQLEKAAIAYLGEEKWCALLRPLHSWRRQFVPHPRRLSQSVFAVVASDDGQVWRWKGVLEMDRDVELPKFKAIEFLIE